MPNKYLTDVIRIISGPLDDLEHGRLDLVEICIDVSRKEITGHVAGKVRERPNCENEDEH